MPPKKRRGRRGDGSFYKRKSDNMWIGAYPYEDEYGVVRRATVSSADKVVAMEKFRALRTAIDSGTFSPKSKMSVETWFTYWLENIVKPNRAPRTYDSYKGIFDNQIKPFLDNRSKTPCLPVPAMLVRANLKWVGEKWSPRTAELTYAVWSASMKTAKKELPNHPADPTELVAKPMNDKKTGKALSVDQARRVLLTATQNKDRMATRWAAALMLGQRQGELLGLERDRIYIDSLTVDVSWQLQLLKTKPGADLDDPDRFRVPDGFEIRPLYRKFALTKRKGARPTLIPLPAPLAAILKVYLETTPPNRFGLTWVSKAGNPIDMKTDNEAWSAALTAAGVPTVRLHDARHTTNTLLLEMGVEESVRMQILGQSTVAAQRRYTHVDLSLARKALGNLDGLLALE
ncbi:tyrosine-type recombinase/integrase [Nocardia africana]|uniref:Site-specific tyrosine recombinase XerC n=1 Tax=Nocardia africana TaxID=134964 RepID=A0A378X366_9NOCA|nr:tyrosine-type recombinase/integrase [Nocardia africana]MCC3311476.1 site-specific integrase [Nocardia africana]SUA47265.1 site-specific tyrosine recombinase XerC [Nocardia africana]